MTVRVQRVKTLERITLAIVACSLVIGMSVGCYHPVRKDSTMVLGKRTWEEWKSQAGWSSYSADSYQPSEAKIQSIAQLVTSKDASFIAFAGSWCPDTIKQLPMIYKIFGLAPIAPNKIELYGVDRKKKEPSATAEKFGIKKVPTLVILSHGKEIGRITEYPEVSWEDDMITILSK